MKKKIILFLIVLFGFFLRIYNVENVPQSLNRDETGNGYDAYSLLKTGKDQYGKVFPLVLRSSDDYKPAIYAYLSIPTIAIFGQTNTAVRLPSVIAGTLTLFVAFYLSRFLLRADPKRDQIALLTALFLAISPWHIQFSRTAYEANVCLFFVLSGMYSFFTMYRSRRRAVIAGVCFGIAVLTYHAARFVVPAIILTVSGFTIVPLIKHKYTTLLFAIVFGIFFLIALPSILSPEAQTRLRVLSIFTDPKNEEQTARLGIAERSAGHTMAARLYHNNRLSFLTPDSIGKVLLNYQKHLDPQNLIFGKDSVRLQSHHTSNMGVVYPWEGVLFVIGLFVLLKTNVRLGLFMTFWMMIGFLPAVITWDIPSYVRSLLVLPTIQIIAATGLVYLCNVLKKEFKFYGFMLAIVMSGIVFYSMGFYLHQYHNRLNLESAELWRFGRKEAALKAESMKKNYDAIYVSVNLDDPYVYFLWNLHYSPQKYLLEGGTIKGGFTGIDNKFDKYKFRYLPDVGKFSIESEPRVLYIGYPQEIDPTAHVIDTIYYPDGNPAILFAVQ